MAASETPSTWIERAIEAMYFGAFRNAGSPMRLLKIAVCVAIVELLISAFSRFELSYHDSLIVENCLGSLIPLGLTFVLYRYALQFRRTGMMLIGEGNRQWSIHMAVLLSFMPKKYAEMDTRFMITGAREIIRASMVARPGDILIMETHLFGDDAKRLKQAHKMAMAFPTMRVWEGQAKKTLSWGNAFLLNRLKRALEKKLEREPTADFRAGDLRGMIVFELPKRTDTPT